MSTDREVFKGPVAEQVRRQILADLGSGSLQPGERLGSERELADKYGVNRSTLRHVLAALAQAGLVHRLPGRAGGTFVSHAKVTRDLTRLDGLPAYLASQGYSAGSRVISTALVQASDLTRTELELGPDEMLAEIVRLRLADGSPISLERAQFPQRIFPDLLEKPLGGSLYELFEKEYGITPAESQENIEVVSATRDEAAMLDIAEGDPLIAVTRISYDGDALPIESSYDLFRADRTRITVRSLGMGLREDARQLDGIVELRADWTTVAAS